MILSGLLVIQRRFIDARIPLIVVASGNDKWDSHQPSTINKGEKVI